MMATEEEEEEEKKEEEEEEEEKKKEEEDGDTASVVEAEMISDIEYLVIRLESAVAMEIQKITTILPI